MNKNKNPFVAHVEDREDLLKELDREKKKELALKKDAVEQVDKYNKSVIIISVIVIFLLAGIAFFWWNISRGKFYAAFNKPFDNSAVESMLYKIDSVNVDDFVADADEIDWEKLLESVKEEKSEDLTDEEKEALDLLLKELDKGKSVGEIISDIDLENINLEE